MNPPAPPQDPVPALSPQQLNRMIEDILKETMPSELPDPEKLYNHFMSQIEPDLMTIMIPTLKIRYAQETPAEAGERKLRYKKAFEEYDRRYTRYAASLTSTVHLCNKGAVESLEKGSRAEDEKKIDTLISGMQSA